ncbi:glycogen synthase [Aurantimicrobium sp. MWH-Uga1]|uniref:glycogen synthase n=1 Tax=Aurantimicrobium sp. MWH-Uga1 TaxID=2079575 RepID=UPI000DED4D07|nr:glycogen synthase [Aurantimicrobium sp. MWH-Uga1]AXE54471.1 Capsular glucan synthase [Aurantimicrobium sp. MWH-Uga1]
MRVDLLTKEYPPEIYGGAGVHVAELVKALRASDEIHVRCFGGVRDERDVTNYLVPQELHSANAALQTIGVNLLMANDTVGADIVHSHTWYANEAGRLSQQLHGIPHVITAHSLEPLRPWKAEQLGGGYKVSSSIELNAYESADAVIAVSAGMRSDILRSYPDIDPSKVHVIHNGIDVQAWAPTSNPELLERWGVDSSRPSIVFVGRITRQKGLPYLLKAAQALPEDVQLILCAGAPDTEEIKQEVELRVSQLQKERSGVIWIPDHLPRHELAAILTSATAFVCPSIYEPLGIVNLEAMACGIPVVGTATGGIPEVIADGETGWLVPIEQLQDGTGTPLNPEQYVADLAQAMINAVSDIERARRMGVAARERARTHFYWAAIAEQTRSIYNLVRA